MADENKSRMGSIAVWVVIAGIAGFVFVRYVLIPPADPKWDPLKEPESALQQYFKYAGTFPHDIRMPLDDIHMCVIEDDWNWWHDNYLNMHQDPLKLSSGIDPAEADMIAKRFTLASVLEHGANMGSVVDKQIGPAEANFVVRKLDGESKSQTDIKVKMMKVGKYWKVCGFAGGRAWTEGKIQPGDFKTAALEKPEKKDKAKETASKDGKDAPAKKGPQAKKPAPPAKVAAAVESDEADVAVLEAPKGKGKGKGPAAAKPSADTAASTASPADILIDQARTDWEAKNYKASIGNAQRALAIYKRQLGENDPKIEAVQKMIDAAQEQQKLADTAKPN